MHPSLPHPFPITFPSLSHHIPITFPSLSHHFPITFPSLSQRIPPFCLHEGSPFYPPDLKLAGNSRTRPICTCISTYSSRLSDRKYVTYLQLWPDDEVPGLRSAGQQFSHQCWTLAQRILLLMGHGLRLAYGWM